VVKAVIARVQNRFNASVAEIEDNDVYQRAVIGLAVAGNAAGVIDAKIEMLNQRYGGARKLDLTQIWDGDGKNPNAALTVFRHFNSASVVKGLVGDAPKTAWVISYPLFERIYYLLVAGYDPFGNLGHQLNSRLYMDFMRMEGEANFLLLLPQAARAPTRDFWYRGASRRAQSFMDDLKGRVTAESGIAFRTQDPQRELYGLLGQRLAPVLGTRFELTTVPDTKLRDGLKQLASVKGASLSWLPEAVVLRIDDATRAPQYFSLLRNTGHSNVSHLVKETAELRPDENTLTVVPGFIGAYPNAIYRAAVDELPALAAAIGKLRSEADYAALADRFVIRRTSPAFWPASDAMTDAYAQWAPLEAGLFDYNRLDNR